MRFYVSGKGWLSRTVDVEEGILGFRYVEWLPSKLKIYTHQDYIVGRECDLAIIGFKLAQIEYICKSHLFKKIGNQTSSMTFEIKPRVIARPTLLMKEQDLWDMMTSGILAPTPAQIAVEGAQ